MEPYIPVIATLFLCDALLSEGVAASGSGLSVVWMLAIVAGLVALVGLGWALGRRSQLSGKPPESLPAEASPRVERHEERLKVDKPVEITDSMTLKEIRQARAAELTGIVDMAELRRQEKERRKTAVSLAVGHSDVQEAGEARELPTGGSRGEGGSVDAAVGTALSGTGPSASSSVSVASASAGAPQVAGRTLAEGLARTRDGFMARLSSLFANRQVVDDSTLEEMEEVLFTADIGVKTSEKLLQSMHRHVAQLPQATPDAVWGILKSEVTGIVKAKASSLVVDRNRKPFVIMMVGVNGAGKTTTIGKLAARYRAQGLKVMMVAGDTFRAAAVDQLVEWARRVDCDVHQGEADTDPSGVVFEGLRKAVEQGIDVVLVDTAGRLQTKKPLMDELQKITRVASKAIPGAPHEVVLVLDANTGQNGIQQARLFGEAAPLTGIVLTKLDGTAKGGVVIGVSDELGLPIYFVGIGEAPEDLRRFDVDEFVDALF